MTKAIGLVRELQQMQEQMARLLELSRQEASLASAPGGWHPPVDVYEDGQSVVVEMELPGLGQEEIDVQVVDGSLVIQGERQRREGTERVCQRNERGFGPFRRTFLLPAAVDTAQIRASCDRGVLTVILPKQPENRPRQIEVAAR